MNILFLDIDGVLNSNAWWKGQTPSGIIRPVTDPVKRAEDINPVMVERLNQIVEASKCNIIISSSWRLPLPGCDWQCMLQLIRDTLEIAGFRYRDRIVSSTPQLGDRDAEIKWFIETYYLKHKNIVILDDFDMGPELTQYHVQTSFWHPELGGLTEGARDEVLKKFNAITA